ncbi:Uracil-DNA glycosylase [Bosea sp. 62]|nr:Uracil-DNA glycosylase [Bosea sp. 7B]CAD5282038.1 Uracil-DNA glycosylase [Bosea sp. 21B]CAD5283687.1 Uracil-DNA glycosylase [Bosea sp. 46]VVT52513.1 Uracil-DNA glycosylase [Bosea sp. EC-HK365B]VXB22290.1 Uracil-DNA glycosylase [Bosea sp. 62]VXB83443.1 Uracil-DNA glycosylase [Bosea sp. 127]VXC47624.1 Uracil-DNA glycosylase [Bosea sp. 29B]VXC85469.1 Uracil-DNA glycosylase [Bosea sp. 125]
MDDPITMTSTMTYRAALDAFLASPASASWRDLSVFRDGMVARACAAVDAERATGQVVAPVPERFLAALTLTPLDQVRVVILGQDPYPTPGHANGLAFSYVGPPPLPRSLVNIYKERAEDLQHAAPAGGDLSLWAKQGVLLLNTALTVREGATQAGSHLKLGWRAVTDEILAAVSQRRPHAVFMLWGAPAQAKRTLIDESRHLVIASAHPSPLSARRGFFGSKPFSQANDWLKAKGEEPIAW